MRCRRVEVMAEYTLDLDKWLKKYKLLLVHAWRHGFSDREAAEKVGISYEEYEHYLAMDERLTQLRDKYVDELLRIAKDNIADKIKQGDRQACEWYFEHRDPEFGAKFKYEEVVDVDTVEQKRKKNQEAIDKFMRDFRADPDMFDGGR